MRHPTAYRSILAVTFTNKATAEMKRRILVELSALARGERGSFFDSVSQRTSYSAADIQHRAAATLAAILRDYSSFAISTIDKFFQRIVRSFFRELGLDLHYQIEIDSKETLGEAIDSLIDRSHTDEQLTKKINRIVVEELDAGHRVDPHNALAAIGGAILSENYAPSTTDDATIEATFESLHQQCQTAAAVLRKMAKKACQLIDDAGLTVDDFKWKNKGVASYFYKLSAANSSEIPSYNSYFKKAADSGDEAEYAPKTTIEKVRPILPELMSLTAEIMEFYNSSLSLRRTYEAIAGSYSRYMLLRHLREEFSSLLASRGQLSLSETSRLISSIIDGAEVPFIFERLGNRYSTIFIDEFQDTSPSQWNGFLPLLHEAISTCDERCVMLIGDIKQAIYRFRGGDWRLLGGAADAEFEGSTQMSQSLTTSWRSDRKIVEFNNAVMRLVVDAADNRISELLDSAQIDTDHLRPILQDAYRDLEQTLPPNKPDGGYVELYGGLKEDTTEWVIAKIHEIETRHQLSRTAILVRTAAEGKTVASALTQAGINIISDELLSVGSSATVCFIINLLRYSIDKSAVTLAAINYFLARPFKAQLAADEQQFIDSLSSMTSIEAFESINQYFKLQKREPFYLQSLYNIIYAYFRDQSTDIRSFIEAWDQSLATSKVALPDIEGAVRILTIHKAKGLEFDAVIIPFFSWGLLPIKSTIWVNSPIEPYDQFNPMLVTYNKELAESIYADHYYEQSVSSVVDNINLIYVALTRAKSELYLGLGEGKTNSALYSMLRDAAYTYLKGADSIGEPAPTRVTPNTSPKGANIEFDSMSSFTPPPLTLDLA